jgi:glycosyltransferase involved in cell wall biosynthesis
MSTDPPRTPAGVTVCVPCFGTPKFLHETLASVAAQTIQALETIVVDDGSLAADAEAIAAISERHGARCVRVTHRGLPNARNAALMLARGEAFLPLDSDDWIEPTYIERTLERLRDADVVCVGLQEHGLHDGRFMPGYDRPLEQVTLAHLWQMNRFYYCSLFRTALLREVGGYNGRMITGFEDWDLMIDLVSRGARLLAVNEVLFHYRTRADGLLALANRDHREANLALMREHHQIEQL